MREFRRTRATLGGFVLAAAAAVSFFLFRPRAPGVAVRANDTVNAPSFVGAVIDVVDFGARPGTIFYVPSGGKETTTVVWLTDDDESSETGDDKL